MLAYSKVRGDSGPCAHFSLYYADFLVTPFVPLTRWFTVMERDLRITGNIRGQSGNAVAPKGFEVSNPWKVRLVDLVLGVRKADTDCAAARETNLLRNDVPLRYVFISYSQYSEKYPLHFCLK